MNDNKLILDDILIQIYFYVILYNRKYVKLKYNVKLNLQEVKWHQLIL